MQRIDNSRVSLGYLNQIDDRLVFDAQHNQRHYLNIHFLLKQTKKDIYIYIYIYICESISTIKVVWCNLLNHNFICQFSSIII